MQQLTEAGALLSSCGTYRYRLWRYWHTEREPLIFIMLNPSTADAMQDDPTIRKCIGFAKRLGFGGIEVVNLFAYRATDPRDLRANGYQVGPDDFVAIQQRLLAWANHIRNKSTRPGFTAG